MSENINWEIIENTVDDKFWNRYISLIKTQVIPYQWEILNDRINDSEKSHAIDNFKIAAGMIEGSFYGEIFQDSDVYKWLEAVGNILSIERDDELERKADYVIDLISKAQEENGYLNTYFTIEAPDKKWTNLLECHELYCAGHFIEAAVAYYRATKKELVLNIAIKLANHIDDTFGYDDNKIQGYPGHQEIELALMKLFDVTKDDKYFELARFFIDVRGTNNFFEDEFEKRDRICQWTKTVVDEPNRYYNQFPYNYYNQFHLPVREQTEAVGHAVRAVYMYTAMADIASRINDESLLIAVHKLWDNITNKKMYITGGIGSTPSGEAFTVDYDLPNDTAYSETCASIGLIYFAHMMQKIELKSEYGDIIERALYNTVLAGMNYDGNRFFYVNPLTVYPDNCYGNPERHHVKTERQKWFSCACCPPNIARTLSSLSNYIYSIHNNTLCVHQYISGRTTIKSDTGYISIIQRGNYIHDGRMTLIIENNNCLSEVALRIPGWSMGSYTILCNGKEIQHNEKNGYMHIDFDESEISYQIEISFDMTPQFIQSNSRVSYNEGYMAVTRGPVVYCIEEIDNGKFLGQIRVLVNEEKSEFPDNQFDGAIKLKLKGVRKKISKDEKLYSPLSIEEEETDIVLIPYYLWNNRGEGEMRVWLNYQT
jgi:DUF1680 family protein